MSSITMVYAEVERFIAEQQYKCDRLLNEVIKVGSVDDFDNFDDFNDLDNSTDRYHPKKYHDLAEANATVNEIDDRIKISSCPPIMMELSCWSLFNASGTAVLSCPQAWIMRYNLTNSNLRNLTVSSNVCLARDQNLTTSWHLCAASSAFNTNDDANELKYLGPDLSLLKYLSIIRTVSVIGYTTSLITLIIAMVIFSLLRKLRNPRNRLHMHLFASFIMRASMALLKYWIFIDGVGLSWDLVFADGKTVFIKEHGTWMCKVFTSLWQYSIVANYTWILMEGLYLHNLILLTLCFKTSTITPYIQLGWGLPGLIVVPWIVIRATIEDTLCWTTYENPLLFLVISIPIVISILLNFVLFLNIVRVLFVKLKTSMYLQQKKMQYKKWAKSTLFLIPLFGAHYTLFLELSYHKGYYTELIWLFGDQLFASFQGTFVALLYCLLNGEVRAEILRTWKTRRSKRDFSSSNFGHRELPKNIKKRINRKRHRSEGDNVSQNVGIPMRELSLP